MPNMNIQHIARLEAQLEKLVEGTFTHLFGKHVRAHDIALELSRAMEDNADRQQPQPGEQRPLAPDRYVIHVREDVRANLLSRQPSLPRILGEHLVELASNAGFRLNHTPTVEIQSDNSLRSGQLVVKAGHSSKKSSTTAIMQRVELSPAPGAPENPQLIIYGKPAIPLTEDVINVGRSRDNHIVIDDPAVSRYHLQIRLRFGRYTLFDARSQSGTYVNDVRISEYPLHAGDVIRIGNTQIVYMEDQPPGDSVTGIWPEIDGDAPGAE
jgi:hypothetical protein